MSRRRLLGACAIALAAGCGGKVFIDAPAAGGSAGAAGAAGAGGGCSTDLECGALDDACNFGACVSGVCMKGALSDGIACEDGLFCTTGDVCMNGACVSGLQLACSEPGACNTAVCDEASKGCSIVPLPDGTPCGGGSCDVNAICISGMCSSEPVDCSALNGQCTIGLCQPGLGCVAKPINEGGPCEDGNPCTSGEHCAGGSCVGGAGGVVFFFDDFHDASKGWSLGPEWQIGPTKASPPGTFGSDPDLDHSPTADNGVAGTVLGGNVSTGLHPFSYLESPPFDTTGGPGPVLLQFHRWMNADYPPFMHNEVAVWDGGSWKVLWAPADGVPIQDSPPVGAGWTLQQLDITPYKSAGTKIRFGFDVASEGVFTIGGWNVDDVRVASAPCP